MGRIKIIICATIKIHLLRQVSVFLFSLSKLTLNINYEKIFKYSLQKRHRIWLSGII